jgi:PAS domain-containing protein
MSGAVILDATGVFADAPALARAAYEIDDCVVWVAHRDGGLKLINAAIERWTGLPPYSAVGMGWLRAVRPAHREHCYGTLLTALRESKPWSLNFSLRGVDDDDFWVVAGARCVVDTRRARLLGAVGACVRLDAPDPFRRLHAVLAEFPGRAAALSAEGQRPDRSGPTD